MLSPVDTRSQGDCHGAAPAAGSAAASMVPAALRYVVLDGSDAGLAQLRGGYANARYDSRDGYGPHVHERAYIVTDHICPHVN